MAMIWANWPRSLYTRQVISFQAVFGARLPVLPSLHILHAPARALDHFDEFLFHRLPLVALRFGPQKLERQKNSQRAFLLRVVAQASLGEDFAICRKHLIFRAACDRLKRGDVIVVVGMMFLMEVANARSSCMS